MPNSPLRQAGIFATACVCGVAAGMFGVGGGVVLVPLLGLLFHFAQHRAQGTSLITLVPPTGLLAFVAYSKAGYVDWRAGLLLIPGMFAGGILGARIAERILPRRMQQAFAVMLFALGAWQVIVAWRR